MKRFHVGPRVLCKLNGLSERRSTRARIELIR